jgi:hypothetical protein
MANTGTGSAQSRSESLAAPNLHCLARPARQPEGTSITVPVTGRDSQAGPKPRRGPGRRPRVPPRWAGPMHLAPGPEPARARPDTARRDDHPGPGLSLAVPLAAGLTGSQAESELPASATAGPAPGPPAAALALSA